MTVNILFAAKYERWPTYEPHLRRALDDTGIAYALAREFEPQQVDYIVYAPNSEVQDFTPYTRLKAVLNLWAGVEEVTRNHTLNAPLARMVDDGLTRGMVEWVTGHVLRHHLGMDAYIVNPGHKWDLKVPPLARDRSVAILGLGALGRACAETLARIGFRVSGWSRSPKDIPGVTCHHGDAGLSKTLSQAEILVLLLPDTPATENTLNADTLAALPKGAVILNPGRGPLIDDTALIDALNSGQVGHATLDTFRVEPLPADHPYWSHPNVTVTPHCASETRPDSASRIIAENVARGETDRPLLYLVDRDSGY